VRRERRTTVYCWARIDSSSLGTAELRRGLPRRRGTRLRGFTRAGPYGNYKLRGEWERRGILLGENSGGPLGNGSGSNTAVPVPVSGGLAFTTLAAARNHNAVSPQPGRLLLGFAIYGELGTGTVVSGAPAPVTGNLTFQDITVGVNHTCV